MQVHLLVRTIQRLLPQLLVSCRYVIYLDFLFDISTTLGAPLILQLALVLGLILSILLGIGLRIGSRLFTSDQGVLHHIYIGIPV